LRYFEMSRRLTQEIDLDSGVVVKEAYRMGQKLHRDPSEGPAVIERAPETGQITVEEYYVNGLKHRDDGPAVSSWFKRGCVLETYYIKGRQRNPAKGPALRQYNLETGIVEMEEYLLDRRRHRNPAKGPASIHRHPVTGEVYRREYYQFGKRVPEPERGAVKQSRAPSICKPSL
jgi:hypothetical protein